MCDSLLTSQLDVREGGAGTASPLAEYLEAFVKKVFLHSVIF